MGSPAFLIENVFSTLQFPGHVLSTTDGNGLGASGYEVYHVGNGRRAPTDRYQADSANAARQLRAAGDRVRYVTGLALDRGHNLAGVAISVLGSNDAWTTSFTIWSGTVPSVLTSPGQLDNTNGVVTEEGAFLVRFPGSGAMSLGLSIPALGASIAAQVVGAWLGQWWAPGFFDRPWAEDGGDLLMLEQESSSGWTGNTVPVHRRSGTIGLKQTLETDYLLARLHIQGHFFAAHRPMWIVQDDAQADRACLAIRPKGHAGFGLEPGWFFRQAKIPYQEHEPLRPGG